MGVHASSGIVIFGDQSVKSPGIIELTLNSPGDLLSVQLILGISHLNYRALLLQDNFDGYSTQTEISLIAFNFAWYVANV